MGINGNPAQIVLPADLLWNSIRRFVLRPLPSAPALYIPHTVISILCFCQFCLFFIPHTNYYQNLLVSGLYSNPAAANLLVRVALSISKPSHSASRVEYSSRSFILMTLNKIIGSFGSSISVSCFVAQSYNIFLILTNITTVEYCCRNMNCNLHKTLVYFTSV